MTPSAQSNLEHGQEKISSEVEYIDTPVDHVEHVDIQQGSMAPPTAISSDQLIDPHLSLDPDFLVPIEETVGSDPTKSTHLLSKCNESLELPSTEDNSDSRIKTEEFLEFVDELSQEPSPLSDREGTLDYNTAPSVIAEENSHSIVVDKTSESVNSSNKSTDLSIDKVPKGNDVESTDISITESQFSSTMPYLEESLVAKLDPLGQRKILSAQPCHKEETTLPHEGADLVTEEGTSVDSTKDCSSGTSASKILTEVTHVKFDSVSDINTETKVDHGNLQSRQIPDIETSEPNPSPVQVRKSTRSTRGIPPTRYGSVVSHQVNVHEVPGRRVEFIYYV